MHSKRNVCGRLPMLFSAVLLSIGIGVIATPSASAAPQAWAYGSGDIPDQPFDCVDAGAQVDCAAAGQAYSTNAGATWTASTTTVAESFQSTSCAVLGTSVDCSAVGGPLSESFAAYTTDGGVNWQAAALPAGVDYLTTVQCFALNGTASCAAVANNQMLFSDNGGATWTTASLAGSGFVGLDTLSCAPNGGDEDCSVISFTQVGPNQNPTTTFDAWYWTNGGEGWAPALTPSISLNANPYGSVSCVPTSGGVDCASSVSANVGQNAYGNTGLYSTDGGQSWSLASGSLTGVQLACSNVAGGVTCTSIGGPPVGGSSTDNTTSFSTNGGITWTLGEPVVVAGSIHDLSCTASGFCVQAGGSFGNSIGAAVVESSTDGGVEWTPSSLPLDWGTFTASHAPGRVRAPPTPTDPEHPPNMD